MPLYLSNNTLKLINTIFLLLHSTNFNVMNYYTSFNKNTSLTPLKMITKTPNWKW